MITRHSYRRLIDLYEYHVLMLNLKYFSFERLNHLGIFPSGDFTYLNISPYETIPMIPARDRDIPHVSSFRVILMPNGFDESVDIYWESMFYLLTPFFSNKKNLDDEKDYLEYVEYYRPFLDDECVSDDDKNNILEKIREKYLDYINFSEIYDYVYPDLFADRKNLCEPEDKSTCNICLSDNAYIKCGREKCEFVYCPECFVSGTCITTMCCGCRYFINPDEIIIDFEFKKLKRKKRNYFKKKRKHR